MHITLGKCPSSDKSMRCKHGRHYHQYSFDTLLLTAIISSSTVGCADGGRWSRSNRGDMHHLYLSYLISIFHIGVGSEVKKFYEFRVLTFDACEMSLRLFLVGMVLHAYISWQCSYAGAWWHLILYTNMNETGTQTKHRWTEVKKNLCCKRSDCPFISAFQRCWLDVALVRATFWRVTQRIMHMFLAEEPKRPSISFKVHSNAVLTRWTLANYIPTLFLPSWKCRLSTFNIQLQWVYPPSYLFGA